MYCIINICVVNVCVRNSKQSSKSAIYFSLDSLKSMDSILCLLICYLCKIFLQHIGVFFFRTVFLKLYFGRYCVCVYTCFLYTYNVSRDNEIVFCRCYSCILEVRIYCLFTTNKYENKDQYIGHCGKNSNIYTKHFFIQFLFYA